MLQVHVESKYGSTTFPAQHMEDAYELAEKMGVLMFDVMVTIYAGTGDAEVLEMQHWYNGMVTYMPNTKVDLSKCGVCEDEATSNNGMIGLCDECNKAFEAIL